MSALPPESSEPGAYDPLGVRYPNTARIWNYHLRGKDNFEADRQAGEAVNVLFREMGVPSAGDTAVETRHLLQRMVDYMLGQGVRQFLDLGSGLPNMANTHQVARRVAPEARVVYVDIDPIVSSHASALMTGSSVVTLQADLREPDQVLATRRSVTCSLRAAGRDHIHLHAALPVGQKKTRGGSCGRFRDAVVPGATWRSAT